MKKLLIYTWLPCLLAMFMSATFASCSDDDDDETTTTATGGGSIVGTWKFQGYTGEWDFGEEGMSLTYIFNEDGTCTSYGTHDGESVSDKANYTYNAENYLLTFTIDGEVVGECCVKLTSSDTFIMWYEDESSEEEHLIFKKQ